MNLVYISGPVTGIPEYNFPAFKLAESYLRKQGYRTINPADIARGVFERIEKPQWKDFMRVDLKYLIKCDAIYMLVGWKKSRGARIEHFIAKILEMEIVYQEVEEK
jgi:hypothetical protein